MTFAPALPVFLFDFIEALTMIITIIDFIVIYKLFYPDIVKSQIIGFVIAVLVVFLLVIPYTWFAWFLFLAGFAYSFFWGFKPWTWAKDKDRDLSEEAGP
ncbi:MAG: hypothetical protein V1717_00835 [Candidatus Micrarchaeota archaeon]